MTITPTETTVEIQLALCRYIGRLEGIIEGSDIDKERYDDIQRAFDAEIAELEKARAAMAASMAASAARKETEAMIARANGEPEGGAE